jgi:GTP cyclohydrolase IA
MKTDYALGLTVRKHLIELGIETPMVPYDTPHEVKLRTISNAIHECMTVLGLDLTDDSLADTPNRVAKMWVNELFSGLDYTNFPKITCIENKMKYDEMVLVSNISAMSSCEHHLITVDQNVHIAYIPGKKVVGLSKLPRLAKFFARRPEVQERFCAQVFETLKFLLDTDDVAVSVVGKHYCMSARGVEDVNAVTTTNKLGGVFKTDPATRSEFFKGIK